MDVVVWFPIAGPFPPPPACASAAPVQNKATAAAAACTNFVIGSPVGRLSPVCLLSTRQGAPGSRSCSLTRSGCEAVASRSRRGQPSFAQGTNERAQMDRGRRQLKAVGCLDVPVSQSGNVLRTPHHIEGWHSGALPSRAKRTESCPGPIAATRRRPARVRNARHDQAQQSGAWAISCSCLGNGSQNPRRQRWRTDGTNPPAAAGPFSTSCLQPLCVGCRRHRRLFCNLHACRLLGVRLEARGREAALSVPRIHVRPCGAGTRRSGSCAAAVAVIAVARCRRLAHGGRWLQRQDRRKQQQD